MRERRKREDGATHAKVTKTAEGGWGRDTEKYGGDEKKEVAGVPVCERHSPLGSCFTGQLGNHPALYPSRPLPPLAPAFHAGGGQLLSSPRPSPAPASDP